MAYWVIENYKSVKMIIIFLYSLLLTGLIFGVTIVDGFVLVGVSFHYILFVKPISLRKEDSCVNSRSTKNRR